MKVSREQVAANRERILQAAGRLFRERGFDGIGLADIMKAAGLTHGAFYGHFESKDDLAAAACASALARLTERWEAQAAASPDTARRGIVQDYLADRHRDDPGTGCLYAALGAEVVRRPPAVRHAATVALKRQVACLEQAARAEGAADPRTTALATMAGMVGALILARMVDDPALGDELRQAVQQAVAAAEPALT
ncbi:TetR/AcrR family transcriptional regulator [Zavarzinia sp. CC-PAN008]|uniref:TetR/AcrR family transcriptional regulator n=1 Tax=Zavarzinia sp. CC-PAN008 TaxID=3243332 RepID=UPI003F742D0F